LKAFLIDIAICNGCYNCQIACKDEHCSNDWRPYAAPQPETGQFWLRLNEHIRGTVPKVKMHYVPVLCQHCDDAPCMEAASDAVYKRDDGLVVIDPEKAAGNRALVDSCPYGAIFFNEGLALPQKCTGCAHLLDRGWKEPRCVDACPTGALQFKEEDELDLTGAEPLLPGAPGKPRVYYKHIPMTFIGGTLYDPQRKRSWKRQRSFSAPPMAAQGRRPATAGGTSGSRICPRAPTISRYGPRDTLPRVSSA